MENKDSFNIRVDSNAPCGSSSSDFTRFTSTVTSQSMTNGLGSSSNSSSGLERRRKNRGSSNERCVSLLISYVLFNVSLGYKISHIIASNIPFYVHYRSSASAAFNNISPSAVCNTNASNSSGGSGGRQRHSSSSTPSQLPNKRSQPLLLQSNVMFKLPNNVKLRLCKFLDSPQQTKDKNDWRALATQLRMESYISFFEKQSSPTECVLSLWEVQYQTGGNTPSNPVNELMNHLKVIGRNDVALVLEKDVGPWV